MQGQIPPLASYRPPDLALWTFRVLGPQGANHFRRKNSSFLELQDWQQEHRTDVWGLLPEIWVWEVNMDQRQTLVLVGSSVDFRETSSSPSSPTSLTSSRMSDTSKPLQTLEWQVSAFLMRLKLSEKIKTSMTVVQFQLAPHPTPTQQLDPFHTGPK